MALKVLLQDHWMVGPGITKAGTVLDEDELVATQLEDTKAPLATYVEATFNPVVQAYMLQRARLPTGSSCSLAEMLRAAGLLP